jgi:hypothetical protein
VSEFLYIAIQDESDDALECAGYGQTVEEAIEECYTQDAEGNACDDALINVFAYAGTYRKKVETRVEKVEKKEKKG